MTTGTSSFEPKRGEIWRVEFDPTIGDEIQKTRPAIVISADGLEGLELRLVVPITGWKASMVRFSWLVKVHPSPQNGLTKLSAANPLQTRSVSLERFSRKLGVIEDTQLQLVLLGLSVVIKYP
ncbi:type II toxin-antitoxin system PemK/MazF family toxin [Ancylothrix sp. C2]|uniref:type II toxin-antitoxin system PemK/MazF family toxin n=1 Tax=Ancylothrix sp. D3o TaxID=2953691 RepID=UPI0021BA6B00|nr:type II toxin-antitoxin system PemK/MazF family toxin [Ancylothrix sp. D3o]MCT7951814.1 type II toxin-antitoxin system PemK/MazF family toxin [Ancylothrix sp. D3o]